MLPGFRRVGLRLEAGDPSPEALTATKAHTLALASAKAHALAPALTATLAAALASSLALTAPAAKTSATLTFVVFSKSTSVHYCTSLS
ncbi:MAG: hypothetical protein GXO56_07370 [Chloroflexi bacterium]|nr:hypothetical protein [Chloroflexota bacterium]